MGSKVKYILSIAFIMTIFRCNSVEEKKIEYLYFDNGKVWIEMPLKDNKVYGWYKRYNYNGELELKAYITNNIGFGYKYKHKSIIDEGMFKIFERRIDIKGEEDTHSLMPIGLHKEYFQTGKIKAYINYSNNGWNEGNSIYFYENGVIQRLERFENEFENGRWFYYDSLGVLVKTEDYDYGKIINEKTY